MSVTRHLVEGFLLDKFLAKKAPMTLDSYSGRVIFAVIFFFASLGVGFVLYGVHSWLEQVYRPEFVAMMMGGLCLFLALLGAGGAYLPLRYRQRQLQKVKDEVSAFLKETVSMVDDELSNTLRDFPQTSLLLAALAGFLIQNTTQKIR